MIHLALYLLLQAKPDVPTMDWTGFVTTTTFNQTATTSESIKDGVYEFRFTDPNNRWRCHVTGTSFDAGANSRDEAGTATIVCVRPHDVKTEPKP